MITTKISKTDFSMLIDELTRYELNLHKEWMLLKNVQLTKNWPERKRYLYISRELKRVSSAIDTMTGEYDAEWGYNH